MKDGIDSVPMMLLAPPPDAVDRRLRQVQRMFHRSLACWASDVLLLRQANMHHLTWRSNELHGWSNAAGKAA